jgi:hypothetical protein
MTSQKGLGNSPYRLKILVDNFYLSDLYGAVKAGSCWARMGRPDFYVQSRNSADQIDE